MERFYDGVVKHRKGLLILFVAVSIFCMILQNAVGVNYDMNDYLPDDAASTVALEIMEAEFSGGIPNARVLIKNVTIPQALANRIIHNGYTKVNTLFTKSLRFLPGFCCNLHIRAGIGSVRNREYADARRQAG